MLHDNLLAGNFVFFSIDLENGGENCGIVQLSDVGFKRDGTPLGEFNSHVRPVEGFIWSRLGMEVTKSLSQRPSYHFRVAARGCLARFHGF